MFSLKNMAVVLSALSICCFLFAIPSDADAGFGVRGNGANVNVNGFSRNRGNGVLGGVANIVDAALFGRRQNVNINLNNGRGFGGFGNVNNFNAFGTRTVRDNRGNIFEVDIAGNARLVRQSGNNFGFSNFSNFRGSGFCGVGVNGFNGFGSCR